MAKIFKGLVQSGLWGCFDEFNRILLEVLSVVAMQVESIGLAKKQHVSQFMFPEEQYPINIVQSVGYFITMNPGYAGRQELPENLNNWVITTLKFWKSYNYFAGAVLPVCTQSKIEEVFKAYILVGKNPGLKGVTQIASAFPELQDCDPMKIHAYIKDRLARLK